MSKKKRLVYIIVGSLVSAAWVVVGALHITHGQTVWAFFSGVFLGFTAHLVLQLILMGKTEEEK